MKIIKYRLLASFSSFRWRRIFLHSFVWIDVILYLPCFAQSWQIDNKKLQELWKIENKKHFIRFRYILTTLLLSRFILLSMNNHNTYAYFMLTVMTKDTFLHIEHFPIAAMSRLPNIISSVRQRKTGKPLLLVIQFEKFAFQTHWLLLRNGSAQYYRLQPRRHHAA